MNDIKKLNETIMFTDDEIEQMKKIFSGGIEFVNLENGRAAIRNSFKNRIDNYLNKKVQVPNDSDLRRVV